MNQYNDQHWDNRVEPKQPRGWFKKQTDHKLGQNGSIKRFEIRAEWDNKLTHENNSQRGNEMDDANAGP